MLLKSLGALLVLAAIALPLGFVALLVLAWYGTDHAPSVAPAQRLAPAQIGHAQRLLERNDPRRARPGLLRTIHLTQDEADLALALLAQRQWQGAARVVLREGEATLAASVPLPTNPFGPWLNVEAVVADTGAWPRLASLRLGRWQVPDALAQHALGYGVRWLQRNPATGPAADAVQRVRITPQTLTVVYAWNDSLPDRLRSALLDAADLERLQACQARLAEQVRRTSAAETLPLHSLLQPVLELAARRAGPKAGAQALADEQRMALVALAFYVNGKGLGALAPAAAQWPAPEPRRVALGGRGDWAQHFTISAALAAVAGTPLADAVGLYKELEDARGGSGFSFADLAADRAGTRFGALAAGAGPTQDRLQRRLKVGLEDQDLLPPLRDLPEFLEEAEFKRRYGTVESAAYKRMAADIERRVGALGLYR